jgi:hypothetical protein
LALEIASSPNKSTFMTLTTTTPAQELFELSKVVWGERGIGDFLTYLLSGTNPLLRNAWELGLGKELYTKREIGPPEQGGGISVPEYLGRQTGAFYELPVEEGERLTRLRFAISKAIKGDDLPRARDLAQEYVRRHRLLWDSGLVDMVPKELRRAFRQEDYQRRRGMAKVDPGRGLGV